MAGEDCKSLYDLHCRAEFEGLKVDVGCIKVAILGNGQTGGMAERLRTLESLAAEGRAIKNGVFTFLAKNWLTITVLAILLFNSLTGGKKIDPQEIQTLADKIVKIEKILPKGG